MSGKPSKTPLVERFFRRVREDTTGCWLWIGSDTPQGYGRFDTGRKKVGAHRFAFELLNRSEIPDGAQLDHLCRVRNCVNPSHLEVVNQRENILRGFGLSAINEGLAKRVPPIKGELKGNPPLAPVISEPRWTGQVRFIKERLADPLRWKKPRRIFVNSMSDLFHEKVPVEVILQIFEVMASQKRHIFQVLTKRPERMKYLLAYGEKLQCESAEHHRLLCTMPLQNVWLGVSVEDQETADERIPLLLQTPAAVRWVSYEPALGPVDFTSIMQELRPRTKGDNHIRINALRCVVPKHLDWIVVGGESGPGARPMRPDWARSVRDQCQAAGVPFFFKQWGAFTPNVLGINDTFPPERLGKKAAGRNLDGREWNEFPRVAS